MYHGEWRSGYRARQIPKGWGGALETQECVKHHPRGRRGTVKGGRANMVCTAKYVDESVADEDLLQPGGYPLGIME